MKAVKNWWQNFLKRLAKANKDQFGSDTPDCCGEPKNQTVKQPKK
jgi:hypothetical protein